MQTHIINFSGGKSSFVVAAWVKDNYPNDNILLYFTDTLWEDEDLYRFNQEVSDKLELPLLIHSLGISPPELMVNQRFMANNRAGICSQELKIKVSMRFLKKGIVPPIEKWTNKQYLKTDDFVQNAILYFGIGFDEMHRAGPIEENWKPFNVMFPLIDYDIDKDAYLKQYAIRQPRLYDLNFTHNNCGGRCVKAGQGHFQNLLIRKEKTYFELMEQEIILSDYIRYMKQPSVKSGKQKDYMKKDVMKFVTTGEKSDKIKNILESSKYTKNWSFGVDRDGNPIKKPFTFMKNQSLADLEKKALQLDFWDLLDIGGCGCSVDFGTCNIDNE
jgi:3'-phosphoadenosine 5'-phosphosulfate sulfotransferase (PAPS reductase)/FAD synthetase